MRRILAVFLSAILVFTISLGTTISVYAGDSDPRIVVSSANANSGETKEITIAFENSPGVASVKLDVAFPSDLTLVSFGDDTTPNGNNVTDPDPESGENAKLWVNYDVENISGYGQQPQLATSPITLVWLSNENVSGDFTFATLKFKVADNATSADKNITVTYGEGDICDFAENEIDFEIVNGKIAILCPEIVVSSEVADKGDIKDITISFRNSPAISSARFNVAFPSDLTLVSLGDDTTSNGNNISDPDPESGENAKLWVNYNVQSINGFGQQPPTSASPVTLNWVSLGFASGDFVFATLKFKVNDGATLGDKDITVTYDKGNIFDIDENDVDFKISNGKIKVVACVHNFVNVVSPTYLVTAGDCTHKAVYYKSCSLCGAKSTETFEGDYDTTKHDYVNKVDATYLKSAADCTHKAVYYKSCSRCGAQSTETFETGDYDTTKHNYVNTVDDTYLKTAGDCTHKAVYYKSCSRCGVASTETFEGDVDVSKHDYVNTVGATYLKGAADCTHKAVYYKSCSRCGAKSTETFETGDVDASKHDYVNTVNATYLKTAGDCTHKAVYYKSCSRCGAQSTETFETGDVDASKHDYVNTVNATYLKTAGDCTHKAVYYKSCSRCGVASTETFEGETKHDYVNTVSATYLKSAADCTHKAVYYKSCSRCGVASTTATFEGDVDTTKHDYVNTVSATYLKSAADCTHKAVYYKSCSRCGAKSTETFETGDVDASKHDYVNTVDATYLKSAADCAHKAVYYKSCSRCGAQSTETFESGEFDTAHILGAWENDALSHWKTCSVCAEKFENGAHIESDWIIDTPAGIGVAGSRHKECTVCGRVLASETIPALEQPKITAENKAGKAGDTIEIGVGISNNPGIISFRNTVTYDESVLELVGVKNTGLLNGYTTPSPTISSPYTLRWADSLATEDNKSNGNIVTLTFKIKNGATEGSYDVLINPVESRNSVGKTFAFEAGKSTVTVVSFIRGDVDDDNEISDWDAILLNRYLAGWGSEINELAADVDNDGEVSDWDAIILERYLAGWDVVIS